MASNTTESKTFNPNSGRLLKHSFIYLFARGVPGVINFLAIAVYTRLLSPEEYGQYVLVIAWVGLGNAVLFQWLRLGLLRFLPRYQKESRSILLATILAAFLVTVLTTVFLGTLLFLFWPNFELSWFLILSFALLLVQAWYELNLTLLTSQLNPLGYGVISLTKAVLALLLGWYLAIRGLGAAGLILGLIFGFLVPGLWTTYYEWHGVKIQKFDRSIFKKLLAYGLPLTATFALNFVVSSSDRIMLGWLKSTEASGLYAVGYDLAQQSLVMLMMVVNLAAYPLAVWNLEQKGIQAAQMQLKQNCILLLAIAMPAAAGLAILAPNIAHVILGEAFRQSAARIIPLISLGAFLMGFKAFYFDLSFQLGQHTQSQTLIALISASVNILLNFWWIPKFGIYGAAYATIIAYALGLVLSVVFGRSIFLLPVPVVDMIKLSMATILTSLTLWPLAQFKGAWALMGQILFGIIIYGTILAVFDTLAVRTKTINLLNKAWRHISER
ncbi:MAG: polysaccharide biosynthesis protein [Thermoanaerobacteraceae bacterium]|nr:polysaccharide biosynthesis protein [Thermoanaerobacteraceae bacterium]